MREKPTNLTLADIKALVEEKRLRWHEHQAVTATHKLAVIEAIRALDDAHLEVVAAHRDYKETKALYRVAKQFNVTDLGQLKMLHKLLGGGQ